MTILSYTKEMVHEELKPGLADTLILCSAASPKTFNSHSAWMRLDVPAIVWWRDKSNYATETEVKR